MTEGARIRSDQLCLVQHVDDAVERSYRRSDQFDNRRKHLSILEALLIGEKGKRMRVTA